MGNALQQAEMLAGAPDAAATERNVLREPDSEPLTCRDDVCGLATPAGMMSQNHSRQRVCST